ncbi:aspartic peptidase domain-containing protein [Mycena amicta]|nr:aspartic peptidase domain-containing protein [Mycena amicta]
MLRASAMLATVLCLIHLALADPLRLPLTRGQLHGTDMFRRDPFDVPFDLQEPGDWYYTSVYIGTPLREFQLLLEMFTSHILVIAPTCTTGCPSSTAAYNPVLSSTSSAQSSSLASISLYSTLLTGYEFTDVVNLGSYTQKKTPIVQVISATSSSWGPSGSLISGTIGLGGSTSADNALWLALLDTQSGIQPEFSFSLARSTVGVTEGGVFIFGGVDTSLYSGEIEFLDTLDNTSGVYWTLGVSELTVQGHSISITPSTNIARIDIYAFGIGAPASQAAEFWAQVPNSSQIIGTSYYQYPCSTELTVSVAFGRKLWPISSADLNTGNYTAINGVEFCVGAVYAYDGTPGLTWSFGPAFLKNVYSVYRQTTGQIGFAELSTSAGGQGTSPGVVPPAIPSSASKSRSSKPIAAIAGGAAGGGVALILAVIAMFCLCRRRRRRNNGNGDTTVATPEEEEVKMEDRDADAMVLVPFVYEPLPPGSTPPGPSKRRSPIVQGYEPSRDRVPADVLVQAGGLSHSPPAAITSAESQGTPEPQIHTNSAEMHWHQGEMSATFPRPVPSHQRPAFVESHLDDTAGATFSANPGPVQELDNLPAQVNRQDTTTRMLYRPPTYYSAGFGAGQA